MENPALRRQEVRRAGDVGQVDLHDLFRESDRGREPVHEPEDEKVQEHGDARAHEEPAARWHSV
jgi:hypothetical protein